MKYFIDHEVWYQGKKLPPRKVEILHITPRDENTVYCYDKDGDEYILPISEIRDTEKEVRNMKIVLNKNKGHVNTIREGLKQSDGYCPCAFEKSEDTKCMCKEFREQDTPGLCHCGLYEKVEE